MVTKRLPPAEKRCQERRKDGTQCKAARRRDSEYCLFHHPYVERHRNELERLSGLELKECSNIHELLAQTVEGVMKGKLTAQQAYALQGLVRLLRENRKDVAREEKEHEEAFRQFEDLKEPEFAPVERAAASPEGETATSAAGRNGER